MPPRAAITQTYKWLERVKNRGLLPTAFDRKHQGLTYTNYQRLLREATAVDFNDLLLCVRDLLRIEAVRSKLQARYKYMLIDEYQDSNPLQVCGSCLLHAALMHSCLIWRIAKDVGFRRCFFHLKGQLCSPFSSSSEVHLFKPVSLSQLGHMGCSLPLRLAF